MGLLTYFCPDCWAEAQADASQCPRCGFRMAASDALPFEAKLILTLEHPIRENRMLAIRLLGELRSRDAIPAFEGMMREEDDPYILGEIGRSLARIDSHESRNLLSRLRSHRSAIVRRFAEDAPTEVARDGS